MNILKTNRLILRPIAEADAPDMFNYSKNPNIGLNAGWKPHENLEETLTIMNEIFINKDDIWGISLREDNRLIGTVGIIPDPKRENEKSRMLGYWLGEQHWYKGYMTEAVKAIIEYGFQTLNLSIISAYCYPHNRRSAKVIEKCGFLYEGLLRQAEQAFDGTILDNLCYSLTFEEYSK